jgi:hypothetical protein
MAELDELEWEDIVWWHRHHQRIVRDHANLEAAKAQLTQLSAVAGLLGGPKEQES